MSNIIDTIQVSGVTYTIAGSGSGNSVVEVTQAQYDALVSGGTVDPTALYIITDAQAGDLTQYWTSAQTQSAITEATSTKQDTLVSGTNLKTINNQSLLGSGNIDIQGGGADVVQTTGTSTTDVMSQYAVTTQLNNKQDSSKLPGFIVSDWTYNKNSHKVSVAKTLKSNGGAMSITNSVITINNQHIFDNSDVSNLNLVETSAITTSIASSSTDAQVPSAKAVYESVSGKVDTSTYNTYTAATDATLASKADTATTYYKSEVDNLVTAATATKQDTLVSGTNIKTINNQSLLGSGNITIQGGGGSGCEVSETTIYNTITNPSLNFNDSDNVKTLITTYNGTNDNWYSINIGDINNTNNYYGYINFSNGGHTGDTSGWENYYDVDYDSSTSAFTFSVAAPSGYKIKYFYGVGTKKVPLAVIESGDPCSAIESGVTSAIEAVNQRVNNAITSCVFAVSSNEPKRIPLVKETPNGTAITYIGLTDLKGTNAGLATDIKIGLGTSGWTELNLSDDNCDLYGLSGKMFKVTYSDGTTSGKDLILTTEFYVNGQEYYSREPYISWQGSSFSCNQNFVTLSYDSTTYELTISVPTGETTYQGYTGYWNITHLRSASCTFGDGITKVESYGEIKQDIYTYVSGLSTSLSEKQDTLVSGTNIKTINNESILGSGNINIQGGGGITSGEVQTMIDESVSGKADTSAVTAVQDSLSGYLTTDTRQEITGNKTFIGSFSTDEKPIIFKQKNDSHKIGFVCRNSASTNNELATFEFRPNTYTVGRVQHPLLYLGHYRNAATAGAGVPQTVVGFRQYDQANSAAYHLFAPLPEEAKTPFSLTTSFQNYFIPLGFKNGSTMIKTDNTGVADFSNVLGGLKLVKLTQTEYDNLSTKDSNTLYVIVN